MKSDTIVLLVWQLNVNQISILLQLWPKFVSTKSCCAFTIDHHSYTHNLSSCEIKTCSDDNNNNDNFYIIIIILFTFTLLLRKLLLLLFISIFRF